MVRKPVPPVVWVIAGATGVAVSVLALLLAQSHGEKEFFAAGDPRMFLLTTRDLFGTGDGFAALGRSSEIPYRYGRMGLPFVAWLLAFGRPAFVGWTLIAVNLAALTAIPALAALLLIEHRAPPVAAASLLVIPGLLVLYGNVVADPLLIALLLLAYVLDARSHRRSTLVVLACAILVKEIAIVALIPLAWRGVRRRDWRYSAEVGATLLPYALWCTWLHWRVGEFPFLTPTQARSGAIGLPFAGILQTVSDQPPDAAFTLTMVAATIALGAAGAWLARGNVIGALAGLYALVVVCLGPEALRFQGEALRVLIVPEVFGILALVIGLTAQKAARASTEPLQLAGQVTRYP